MSVPVLTADHSLHVPTGFLADTVILSQFYYTGRDKSRHSQKPVNSCVDVVKLDIAI